MAGTIPRSFIDDLIARVDIVDLIHARVPLKKAGAHYTARCPFHQEKTPSFSVNRSKQFYHCFGCGAGGDAIRFLQEFEHLSFIEAIETLAAGQGLAMPETPAQSRDLVSYPSSQAVYAILAQAAAFYAAQLRRASDRQSAVGYLKQRGVSGKTAVLYQLGFAPPGWDHLVSTLEPGLLSDAGLVKQKDGSSRLYDRFRNRIIFPIRDRRGRVVGFGGRVLDEQKPKYLNSPETAVFQKSEQVYGLFELLKAISRPERILVVEGYMDVIALAEHGVFYSVATLGTATTDAHMHLLFRYTSELVFCFDGDRAGQQAAWNALQTVLPHVQDGRQVRFMLLPEQDDPDSLVRSEGSEHFQQRIGEAALLSDYFFQQLTVDLNLQQIESRVQLAAEAEPLIQRLPQGTFQQMMRLRLQELAQLPDRQQRLSHQARHAPHHSSPAYVHPNTRAASASLPVQTIMQKLIALLIQNPWLAQDFDPVLKPKLAILKGGLLLQAVLDYVHENGFDTSSEVLQSAFSNHPDARIVQVLARKDLQMPSGASEAFIRGEFTGACVRIAERIERQEALDHLARKLNIDQSGET